MAFAFFALGAPRASAQTAWPGEAGGMGVLTGTNYFVSTLPFQPRLTTVQLWFNASAPGVLISELGKEPGIAIAELFPGDILKVGMPGLPEISISGVALNTWRHLALRYDHVSQSFSAYMDGQPAGSISGSRTNLTQCLYALGKPGATNFGGGSAIAGVIDEFRAYTRALSPAELLRTYDKVIDTTDNFLIAHWPFDSTAFTATAVADTCGRNNNGIQKPAGDVNLVVSTAPVLMDRQPILSRNASINISPVEIQSEVSVNPRGLPTIAALSVDRDGTNVAHVQMILPVIDAPQSNTRRFANLVVGVPYTQTLTASNAHGVVTDTRTFYKSGWQGNAFHFDANDYIQTALPIPQNRFYPTESITIEMWFNPNKGGVLVSEIGRAVIDLLSSGEVKAGFSGIDPISLGQANFNQWNHVAVRYDHVTRNMQGFLNGVSSVARNGNRVTPAEAGAEAHLAFGQGTSANFGGGEVYGGDIDEIRVWNLARTDAQLTEDRFLLLARGESTLVLNRQFDQNGLDVVDSSLNGNVGRKRGSPESILSTAPLRYAVQPILRSDPQVILEFLVNPGLSYKLERSEDLATWTAVETNTVNGGLLRRSQNFDLSRPGEFFRITLQ